jgi:crotonobetainyl-CoA:carnitine CoA-transferase CaiB-like acyl-CoA transferase
MTEQTLGGVKVIEYGHFVAGPYCAKLLADLGAEVIKIEPPGAGDESRRRDPFLNDIPHPEVSGLFLYLNTNKLGITLNLETAAGKDIFKRLIVEADILIEDNPPGKMKELGLDYEVLREINPRLVVTSITPFGQTGPYRNYKAYHLNIYHAGGAGYLLPTGSPNLEREPIKGPGFIGEYEGGLMAAVATLAALYWQGVSGQGQHVDASKQEAIVALEKMELAQYHSEGTNPSRGPKKRGWSPVRWVRSKDGGYVLLESAINDQWGGLVRFMGDPEWAHDEKYSTEEGRRELSGELRERVSEWAKDYTTEELFHGAQKNKCSAAPINSIEELINSPQIEERHFFAEIDHPVAGKLNYPSAPYNFSSSSFFCGRLGYNKQDLVKLKEAGAI